MPSTPMKLNQNYLPIIQTVSTQRGKTGGSYSIKKLTIFSALIRETSILPEFRQQIVMLMSTSSQRAHLKVFQVILITTRFEFEDVTVMTWPPTPWRYQIRKSSPRIRGKKYSESQFSFLENSSSNHWSRICWKSILHIQLRQVPRRIRRSRQGGHSCGWRTSLFWPWSNLSACSVLQCWCFDLWSIYSANGYVLIRYQRKKTHWVTVGLL